VLQAAHRAPEEECDEREDFHLSQQTEHTTEAQHDMPQASLMMNVHIEQVYASAEASSFTKRLVGQPCLEMSSPNTASKVQIASNVIGSAGTVGTGTVGTGTVGTGTVALPLPSSNT
jgi:hypothetical protein